MRKQNTVEDPRGTPPLYHRITRFSRDAVLAWNRGICKHQFFDDLVKAFPDLGVLTLCDMFGRPLEHESMTVSGIREWTVSPLNRLV